MTLLLDRWRAPWHGCGQALALGADAVLLGRLLQLRGGAGRAGWVAQAIDLLAAELHRDLALVGPGAATTWTPASL